MKTSRSSSKRKSQAQPKPQVLMQRSPGDAADWTVRVQKHPAQGMLAMQSADSASSCFPAGTRVTMADGTQRRIEEVRVGDWVLGLSGPVQVWAREVPILGERPLLRFADNSLHWSAEHMFWVKRGEREWLGSHDAEESRREARAGILVGLTKGDLWDLRADGEFYAHAAGWRRQTAQVLPAPKNLELFYLKTTGCHTVMVNGYLVSGGINDTDFDYTRARWAGVDAVRDAQVPA